MFKDQLNVMCMTEFCTPRSKTYAFRHDDDEGNKIKEKGKGYKEMCNKEQS